MKKKLIFLLVLVVVFLGFVLVRYFLFNSQSAVGELRVLSTPKASVFINNAANGTTPFDNKLKAGEYILKLIPDQTATETASWQKKVSIFANALTYVNTELGHSDVTTAGEIFTISPMQASSKIAGAGELNVESDPNGSIVYLDNDEKGTTTLILPDIPKGDHELSIYMPKFLRRTQKINIEERHRVNAYFKLAIDETQKPVSPVSTDSAKKTQTGATATRTKILIKDTPYGWLRVREDHDINATESGRVNTGDTFDLIEEQDGWYKIQFDDSKKGWVYSQYAEKKEP
ncbi:PEGA domain-containing protein [Candidatus Roizmanbacteria bacterium]|nr:PEGA domain-containing protein [Candidatus Roizmanbacteria bacterium]